MIYGKPCQVQTVLGYEERELDPASDAAVPKHPGHYGRKKVNYFRTIPVNGDDSV